MFIAKAEFFPFPFFTHENETVDDIVDVRKISLLRARRSHRKWSAFVRLLDKNTDHGAVLASALAGAVYIVKIRNRKWQAVPCGVIFYELGVGRFCPCVRRGDARETAVAKFC